MMYTMQIRSEFIIRYFGLQIYLRNNVGISIQQTIMKDKSFCNTHGEPYSLYCETCKEFLCLKCEWSKDCVIVSLFKLVSSKQVSSKIQEVSQILGHIDQSLKVIAGSKDFVTKAKEQAEADMSHMTKCLLLETKKVVTSAQSSVQGQFAAKFHVLYHLSKQYQGVKRDLLYEQSQLSKIKDTVESSFEGNTGLAYKTATEFMRLDQCGTLKKAREKVEELSKSLEKESSKGVAVAKDSKGIAEKLAGNVLALSDQKSVLERELAGKKSELEVVTQGLKAAKEEGKWIMSKDRTGIEAITFHLAAARSELQKISERKRAEMEEVAKRVTIVKERATEVISVVKAEAEEIDKKFIRLNEGNEAETKSIIQEIEKGLKMVEDKRGAIDQVISERRGELEGIAKFAEEVAKIGEASLGEIQEGMHVNKEGLLSMLKGIEGKIGEIDKFTKEIASSETESQKEVLEVKKELEGVDKILAESKAKFDDIVITGKTKIEGCVKLKCGHSMTMEEAAKQRMDGTYKKQKGILCNTCNKAGKNAITNIGNKEKANVYRQCQIEVWMYHWS
eukprot:TRINITY_DN837_c0_g2_i5.p1 TRINITY_DN837_c0_g2~~TRINITY_DN837_c0_g2_i5.p1  ORF type:complete len:562 (-),score=87.61 TRINITY_DN837_c0_g2_i5:380-2065(-)